MALYEKYIVEPDQFSSSWSCRNCEACYKQKCHLVEHIEAKHLSNVRFVCPHECGYMGKTRKDIRRHLHMKHSQLGKVDMTSLQFVVFDD